MSAAPARAERSAGDFVAAALVHCARGRAPIPMPGASKKPGRDDWQRERYTAETIPRAFADAGGISLLCGEPSNGLLDVDPDTAEAAAAWDDYRLPTRSRHGRASGYPHDWYTVAEAPRTEQLRDTGAMLIELRSTGGQTVVPPSIHPSGEQLAWLADGEPASVDVAELQRAVRHTAAAALLARHYPGEGSRHDYRLALAGCLLRGGLSPEDATRLMSVSARIAGADAHDAAAAVRDTADAIAKGEHATGAPRLAELLGVDGPEVVKRLREWLGLRVSDEGGEQIALRALSPSRS